MTGGTYSPARPTWSLYSGVLFLLFGATLCPAADESPAAPSVGEKALQYHELLVKRPEPGYLFDRFYNTWLDESTVDSLEAFLLKRVQTSNQTGDRLLLAFFYAKKGDDVSALDQFRQALEHNPASAATWYHKALVEARTLDFDLAVADLKKAREQKPDEKLAVQIDKQLGKILARNRQTAEAVKVWQALLTTNPADEELTEDLIELHIDEGLFKEAAQLEQQLIDRTKDEYLAVTRRLRLGDIQHRSGDRAKAIEIYTAALEAAGTDSWLEREILAQIDQLYRREDDLTGLKKLYADLLQKYAKRIAIHRRSAQLLVETGEQEPAIAVYREILKLTPGERATREEYIGVLSKVGKQDEAIKELQALCEQHPKDAELRFRLAGLHQDAKQVDQAIAAVNKYLEVSDGSEYAYLRGARLLERLEKKDAAAGVYEKMAAKFADSNAAQEAYAAFLYSSGRKEEALKRWRELAKDSDVKQTLQVARTLSSRAENEAALDLLKDRIDDIKNEPLFLGQLVTTAMALKKYDEAIPWAIQRVQLAEAVADLDTAIEQAATSIERAEKTDEEISKLEAMPKRGIPESCLLAELLERTGDSDKADAVLKKAADEGSLLAVSEQVRLFSQRREWAQAADATRKILELPGGLKSLHVRRLVELYQRDYQLEEGLKWIDEWKRLSPGSTMPWVTEARMLQALGKTDEALKVLRTAALRFEDDEDLRVRLAEFYAESEKPADAMRIYWQLYEDTEDLNGKLRWAQKLASIAEGQGTVPQLVQDFDERVRSNRQSIVPLLALSEVYRETDDYEGRRRALTAAAKIKPDDMYLLQQVARVEEQDGDWQAAVATLERAAAMDKTNRTREQIARLHLNYGDAEKGYSILFDLTGAADADPRTLETTADSLCATQEWERAASFLERRVPDHPADYRLRYLLAVALEEAGRPEQAAQQFTQLLSNQQELPTKKSASSIAQQAAQMSNYFDMLRQLLPAEAFEWFQLMQYRHTAYSHRQRGYGQRIVLSGASGGTTRSAIQMPQDVENVRPLALSHLLAIAATLEEDQQAQVCKDLESHGLKHAEQLMRTDPNQGDFRTALPEILEKEPENENALAILVMQQMGARDSTLGDHCAKALEIFRKSRPELAFMAAVQAGVNEARNAEVADMSKKKPEVSNKYLDEALTIAATMENPNPMTIMSLTTALGGRNLGNSEDLPVSEAYRQKLSKLLVKWYPEMSKSPQWGSWAFYSAMQSLSQNNDPTEYVHFLDDEVSRFQTGGKGQGSRNQIVQMAYGRQQQQLLAPLAFPPQQLADFPPHVLASFAKNQNMNPYGFSNAAAPDPEEYSKKIRPLLESIRSPVLRILLAYRAELNDVVEESLKKMLAAKTPQLDTYLLAASWAADHDKHAEAVQLLQKSRYLPMKLELRKAVDGAIVAAVLADKQAAKEQNKEMLEAGQQASLRLRRSRLEPQQRNELISAMEDLGLKKEAEKLDALAAASGTRTTSIQSFVTAAPVARTPADRISKLIEQGKRDAAVKQLAGEVAGNVRQIIANPQNQRYQRQMFRDTKQRIEAHSLMDDVLKSLEPGDSKNSQKITEYAMACQLFDRAKEARAAFERALAVKPKDDAARMQLILILAKEDPAEGGKHLGLLSKTTRGSFGQMISDQMQDYEVPFDVRLGYARLAVQYLQTLEEGDIQQSHWVENLMNVLGRYMHGRRGSLPSLYASKSSASQEREAANQKEVMDDRRTIHRQLCEQMLKMPDLARTGFRHLLASTEAQEKPVDEFAELAEKILLAEVDAKPRTGIRQQQVTYYSSSGQNEVRFRSPEEFLARRAWKSEDWKLIDDTLLPKLATAKSRESRERLEQMATLYRCDESKFLELAGTVTRQSKPALQPGQSNDGLAIAVDVWADRKLDVDLQPLVLKQLKLDVTGQNHYQPPGYVIRFVEGIAKNWTRAQQLAFLEEVATIYVGPPGKRNDFIKKNYNRNNINWGTPNGRIYVYGQLMEQLCQRSDLVFTMLEHLDQYEEPKPVNNFEYRVRSAVSSVQGSGPEATMELLANSPWLEDLDRFRPLVLSQRNSQWESPLVVLLKQDAKKPDFRKNLKVLLEKQQASTPTFGGQLILASLSDEPDSTALLDFVGGQLAAIQALPEKQQQDLAILLRALVPAKVKEKKDLSDAAKAVLAWMTGSQASESRTMLSKLQKAKRLEELGIQHGQADQFIREHLQEMIRNDTDSAVKGFLRLGELAHEAQKRGEWNIGFSDGTTIEGYLLRSVGYTSNLDWKSYNFLVDVLRSKDAPKIETGLTVSQLINVVTNNAMNRAVAAAKTGRDAAENRVRAFYADAGPAVEGRATSLLLPALYPRLSGESDAATCKAVLEWTKNEMNGGKYPQLAADLHALYGLMNAEKERNARKDKSESRLLMADYHEHFHKIISDDTLPIAWRLHIAEFLCDRQKAILPLELVIDIVKLYVAALAEKVPIMNSQHNDLTDIVFSIRDEESTKELSANWCAKWADRYLRPTAATSPGSSRGGADSIYILSDSNALCSALRLYLAAGEEDRAKQLLRKYSVNIGNLPNTVEILVRADQPEEAARILRSGWPRLAMEWPNYDVETEKRLPAMLEKLERDDERYLAKVLFAAMTGPKPARNPNAQSKSSAPSDERHSKLADEFASIEFKDPAMKKLCLVLLAHSEPAGKKVAQEVAAAFDAKNVLLAYASDNSTRLTQETRLATCHLRNRLREGDCDAYVDLLTRLSANPSEDDYQFGNAASPFIDCAIQALRNKDTKPWTPAQCAAMGKALRGLLNDRDYVNINNFETYNALLLVLHCQAGETDDLANWTKKLSQYNRDRIQNSGANNDIWKFGLQFNGPAGADTVDARIRYLQNVMRWAFERQWLTRTGQPYRMRGQNDRNFLTTVVKSGLLTSDELKSRGAEAFDGIGPKEEPNYSKAVLANWLQSNKDYENAAQIWGSMAKIEPDAKKVPRNEANYVLGLAVCLKNLKRFDEAIAAIDVLKDKDFDAALKASYEQYKREIREAAKSEQEKNKAEKEPENTKTSRILPKSNEPVSASFATAVATVAV